MQLSQGQIEEFLFRGVRLPHPADEANISIHQGSVSSNLGSLGNEVGYTVVLLRTPATS